MFALSLSLIDVKEELCRAHNLSCGEKDISLYRRLQRHAYYRHEMAGDAAEMQIARTQCQEPEVEEYLFV